MCNIWTPLCIFPSPGIYWFKILLQLCMFPLPGIFWYNIPTYELNHAYFDYLEYFGTKLEKTLFYYGLSLHNLNKCIILLAYTTCTYFQYVIWKMACLLSNLIIWLSIYNVLLWKKVYNLVTRLWFLISYLSMNKQILTITINSQIFKSQEVGVLGDKEVRLWFTSKQINLPSQYCISGTLLEFW